MTVDKMTEDSPLKLDGLFHIESLLITTHVVINANLFLVVAGKNSRGHVLASVCKQPPPQVYGRYDN